MDYSYEEIIKDLEEVKMMFTEESNGNYPECLDYAMQAIDFISKNCPKSFKSYIKGEVEE